MYLMGLLLARVIRSALPVFGASLMLSCVSEPSTPTTPSTPKPAPTLTVILTANVDDEKVHLTASGTNLSGTVA